MIDFEEFDNYDKPFLPEIPAKKMQELDEDSNNNSVNNTSVSNNNQLPMSFEINKESDTTTGANLDPDFKSLNVQALRQIAEDRQLIVKGEKKTKKELLALLEQHNSLSNK